MRPTASALGQAGLWDSGLLSKLCAIPRTADVGDSSFDTQESSGQGWTHAAPSSLTRTVIAILLLYSPSELFASKILLISSGDTSNDDAIQSVLQSAGDTVNFIGPTFNTFTGSGLSGYNAVFFESQQQQLESDRYAGIGPAGIAQLRESGWRAGRRARWSRCGVNPSPWRSRP